MSHCCFKQLSPQTRTSVQLIVFHPSCSHFSQAFKQTPGQPHWNNTELPRDKSQSEELDRMQTENRVKYSLPFYNRTLGNVLSDISSKIKELWFVSFAWSPDMWHLHRFIASVSCYFVLVFSVCFESCFSRNEKTLPVKAAACNMFSNKQPTM